MVKKYFKMVKSIQKWSNYIKNGQKVFLKWSKIFYKWSKRIKYGQK